MKEVAAILMFHLLIGLIPVGVGKFDVNIEPRNIFSPVRDIGINLISSAAPKIPITLRQPLQKGSAGDYYRSPWWGADSITLASNEKTNIDMLLIENISSAFYDSFILNNMRGYQYQLKEYENFIRREFYIRYSQGDTIYVISGWLDKFLSFYRAVPERIEYDLSELQAHVSRLAAFDVDIPLTAFKSAPRESPYFVEYINKERMFRIRRYHIAEEIGMNEENRRPIMVPRTLIEITKFLDPEMVP